MDSERISELLRPFLTAKAVPEPVTLTAEQLLSISTYIGLILRWNARINLTAVREPDAIITRHFGESLFLAACLLPKTATTRPVFTPSHALDLGSGAGFPGLPLKIYAPHLRVTLVESNQKKAAFLNEVIRSLHLTDVHVVSKRIEARLIRKDSSNLPLEIQSVGLLTMRAVEHFESALDTAAALIRYGSAKVRGGKLALLVGLTQANDVPHLAADFSWQPPLQIPQSRERVLLVGQYSHVPAPEE